MKQKLPWYEKSVKEVYLLNPTGSCDNNNK